MSSARHLLDCIGVAGCQRRLNIPQFAPIEYPPTFAVEFTSVLGRSPRRHPGDRRLKAVESPSPAFWSLRSRTGRNILSELLSDRDEGRKP